MAKFSLPLVLGSSSKSRRSILSSHGFEFTIDKPQINEKQVAPDLVNDPSAYALAVSQAKMDALLPKYPSSNPVILMTSDQVVSWNNKVREKPVDHEECRSYLKGYANAPAETHSAVVVVNTRTGKRVHGIDIAKQYFTLIPDQVIDQLIEKGDVMHCCGGFMIDDSLIFPYLRQRVGDEDSIIGLPMKLLMSLIEQVIE